MGPILKKIFVPNRVYHNIVDLEKEGRVVDWKITLINHLD